MAAEIEQLKRYSALLDNLARHNSSDTFPNKDHKHASIALSKILKYSKKDFILFDDDLKGDIVNNDAVESFKDSLLDFISRDGKVKIVLSDKNQNDDRELVSFIEIIQDFYPKQVQVKLAAPEFKSAMKEIYKEKINFAIGDQNKYRLEKFGEKPVDNKTREANGSFNNQSVVEQLLNVFNAHYEGCSDYFENDKK